MGRFQRRRIQVPTAEVKYTVYSYGGLSMVDNCRRDEPGRTSSHVADDTLLCGLDAPPCAAAVVKLLHRSA